MTRDTRDMFDAPDRGRFGDHEQAPAHARVTNASDLVDLTMALHHQTEKAVLVSADGDEAKAKWIPKSQLELEVLPSFISGRRRNGQAVKLACVVVTLPERVAMEKGLL